MVKCPKCETEINYVDFCGDAYYGSYDFNKTYNLKFACPKCEYIIFVASFNIKEENLKVTDDMYF